MNCTTPTRLPRPSMRSARPKAAVDLPLPGPVWTMRSPFSIVFSATSASCTALRFAILARWRSASSTVSVMAQPFNVSGSPATTSTTRSARAAMRWLSRPCRSAKRRASALSGTIARADLVRHQHGRPAAARQRLFESRGVRLDVGLRQHAVGEPQREAIDEKRGVRRRRVEGAGKIVRRFHGLPRGAAARAMVRDALRHLRIERLRGRDVRSTAAAPTR